MNGATSDGQWATGWGKWALASLLIARGPLCCLAADTTPPRLFFSDAKLSFVIPESWEVSPAFPYGPLFTRKAPDGTEASLVCQISDPVDPGRLSADVPVDVLQAFASRDISRRAGGPHVLSASARTLAGQNAYETTWQSEGTAGKLQSQSVYFFMDNRYYVLSLQANRDSFPSILPDFQAWLKSVHILSRRNSGKLEAPAHGGLWVHQTGGAKIVIPVDWLVGVADDRQVGAALARDKMNLALTIGVDIFTSASKELGEKEKTEARHALVAKGYTVLSESQEPFHAYPCFRILYEGALDGRFVRGQDLWVSSPKARWLISIDGDGSLLRQLTGEWQGILDGIQFL